MVYFSWKNLVGIFLVLLVILVGVFTSKYIDQKYPNFEVFSKYKDFYIDDMKVSELSVKQGDSLTITTTVYNMSDKEKQAACGVYLIDNKKTYDGHNIDYAAQKQSAKVPAKSKMDFTWNIPVGIDAGNYKALFWLHEVINQAEFVTEDNWYSKTITVLGGSGLNEIRGEELSQKNGLVMSDLLISPKQLRSGSALNIQYKISNYSQNESNVITGVYLMEKSKNYNGENVDKIMKKDVVGLPAGADKDFNFNENIDLPRGEYKVLIWLHKMEEGKEALIFDYWAPGNLVLE